MTSAIRSVCRLNAGKFHLESVMLGRSGLGSARQSRPQLAGHRPLLSRTTAVAMCTVLLRFPYELDATGIHARRSIAGCERCRTKAVQLDTQPRPLWSEPAAMAAVCLTERQSRPCDEPGAFVRSAGVVECCSHFM